MRTPEDQLPKINHLVTINFVDCIELKVTSEIAKMKEKLNIIPIVLLFSLAVGDFPSHLIIHSEFDPLKCDTRTVLRSIVHFREIEEGVLGDNNIKSSPNNRN